MKRPDLRLILYCQCQQASLLASESLDRKLSFSERMAMRMHQGVCAHCRRFAKQLQQLQTLIAKAPAALRQSLAGRIGHLSPVAKRRIASAMRDQTI